MLKMIRPFQDGDLQSLASIYRDAIQRIGHERYTAEQVAAWSSHADDPGFAEWIATATTFVAVSEDGACMGFGGLQSHGRIASLFVAPQCMRTGVGSRLLERLLQEFGNLQVSQVTTEASEFSKPLFEKYGFSVSEVEHTTYRGVAFTRYAMRRELARP